MSQFHKPTDEKRSIVVIGPQYREQWLTATYGIAFELFNNLMEQGFSASEHTKARKTSNNLSDDSLLDLMLPPSW